MFWNIFYALCKEKGTSPNAVCKEIGLSNAAATGWKNGKLPKLDVLVKIADHLDVSIDYLAGRTSSPFFVASWDELYSSIDKMTDAQLDSLVRKVRDLLAERQSQD